MTKLGAGLCRRFAQAYLKTLEPEAAAREAGLTGGESLLERPEIQKEIQRQKDQWFRTLGQEDIARRAAQLAFGRSNDCVKLALQQDMELDGLDLSLLSEIKRSEKGAVEIKMVDRMKALEYLNRILEKEEPEDREDPAAAFLEEAGRICRDLEE